MCFFSCRKKNKIRDFSYMKSPVQASRFAHSLKNYDRDVGAFYFNGYLYLSRVKDFVIFNKMLLFNQICPCITFLNSFKFLERFSNSS